MAYKDPIKQREYQRIWARSKKDPIPDSLNYRPSVVTWQQLTGAEDLANRADSWEDCIRYTKDCMGIRQVNRVAIALLALKACKIVKGGDVKSVKFAAENRMTIIRFAGEVGLHKKTLNDWINITQAVVMKLPQGTASVDFHAAKMAHERTRGEDSDTVVKKYQELINPKHPARQFEYFMRGVMQVNNGLSHYAEHLKDLLTEKDIEKIAVMKGFLGLYFKDLKSKAFEDADPKNMPRRSPVRHAEALSELAELRRMGYQYKPGMEPKDRKRKEKAI